MLLKGLLNNVLDTLKLWFYIPPKRVSGRVLPKVLKMPAPWIFAKWEGLLLLGGFFAIVLWKLANGSIGLDQLFEGDILDRDSKDIVAYSTYVSAGRVQSFLVTVLV